MTEPPSAREEVLDWVAERVDEDDPTVGLGRMFDRARKDHFEHSRGELEAAFEQLKRDGELVAWMYATTLNEDLLLQAWIRQEASGDGYTRKLLISKLNRVIAGTYEFRNEGRVNDEAPDPEQAVGEGAP